jgi:hypothetical protein
MNFNKEAKLVTWEIVTEYESCKGLIYRYRESNYINSNNEIVFTQKFIPMKKLSCTGCKYCEPILDSVRESMSCGVMPSIQDNLITGDLVRLETVVTGIDYESGYADEWEEQFIKIERKRND